MDKNFKLNENNELMKNKIIEFTYLFTFLNKQLLLKNITLKTRLSLLNLLDNLINLILMFDPKDVNPFISNIEKDNFNILSKHLSLITKKYAIARTTNKTKNRSLVSFSNRKLWKQKGTGRARAGSKKSPLFRGGGVVFGPAGFVKTIKINKKLSKKLFFASVVLKLKNLLLLDLLDKADIESLSKNNVLVLTDNIFNEQNKLYLKYSNYKNINFKPLNIVNSFDVLRSQYILIEKENLFKLLKRLILS